MYVIWVHTGLKEGVSHVDCSPDFSVCAIIQDVVNLGEGEGIRDGVSVKLTIIANPTRKYGGVFFGDYEGGGHERGAGRPDET